MRVTRKEHRIMKPKFKAAALIPPSKTLITGYYQDQSTPHWKNIMGVCQFKWLNKFNPK